MSQAGLEVDYVRLPLGPSVSTASTAPKVGSLFPACRPPDRLPPSTPFRNRPPIGNPILPWTLLVRRQKHSNQELIRMLSSPDVAAPLQGRLGRHHHHHHHHHHRHYHQSLTSSSAHPPTTTCISFGPQHCALHCSGLQCNPPWGEAREPPPRVCQAGIPGQQGNHHIRDSAANPQSWKIGTPAVLINCVHMRRCHPTSAISSCYPRRLLFWLRFLIEKRETSR